MFQVVTVYLTLMFHRVV